MYQNSSYDQRHFSSIGITKELNSNDSFSHKFIFSWYFPNAFGSHNGQSKEEFADWNITNEYHVNQKITKRTGNYYNNYFNCSASVADYMVNNLEEIENSTSSFFNDYYSSDLDMWLLEQISSNLNTFRTSSTFDEKGRFGLREGMSSDRSWGPNITSDVTGCRLNQIA